MLPWQQHNVNLLAAIFSDQRIKGFRGKGEWNTHIKKLCSATLNIVLKCTRTSGCDNLLYATTSQRPVFQTTKGFQVKSLHLEPLISHHLSQANTNTFVAKSLKFSLFLQLPVNNHLTDNRAKIRSRQCLKFSDVPCSSVNAHCLKLQPMWHTVSPYILPEYLMWSYDQPTQKVLDSSEI